MLNLNLIPTLIFLPDGGDDGEGRSNNVGRVQASPQPRLHHDLQPRKRAQWHTSAKIDAKYGDGIPVVPFTAGSSVSLQPVLIREIKISEKREAQTAHRVNAGGA